MKRFFLPLAILVLSVPLVGCPVMSVPVAPIQAPATGPTPLLDHVRQTLRSNQQTRTLSTDVHGAWQILHGVLAYGQDFEVQTSRGPQRTIDYLLAGGTLDGFEPRLGDPVGELGRRGVRMEIQPTTKVGQGHRDQWLAILVQSGLSPETTIRLGDSEASMLDWVNQAEFDVPMNINFEFSWTLIGLTAYRPTSHQWTARDGTEYSTELLLDMELNQDIASAVCGGTHRLIGIAMTLAKRQAEGAEISGVWADARATIDEAIQSARQNQNSDGSYSIAYLHRSGWARDLGESIGTTGHVLEFLSIAADEETLREPWVERTVRRLCTTIDTCVGIDLECGALYHALHGLSLYEARMSTQ